MATRRVFITIATALILASAIGLSACSKSYTSSKDFEGTTWVCTADEGSYLVTYTLDLNKDNTYALEVTAGDFSYSDSGMWYYKDGAIVINDVECAVSVGSEVRLIDTFDGLVFALK